MFCSADVFLSNTDGINVLIVKSENPLDKKAWVLVKSKLPSSCQNYVSFRFLRNLIIIMEEKLAGLVGLFRVGRIRMTLCNVPRCKQKFARRRNNVLELFVSNGYRFFDPEKNMIDFVIIQVSNFWTSMGHPSYTKPCPNVSVLETAYHYLSKVMNYPTTSFTFRLFSPLPFEKHVGI